MTTKGHHWLLTSWVVGDEYNVAHAATEVVALSNTGEGIFTA